MSVRATNEGKENVLAAYAFHAYFTLYVQAPKPPPNETSERRLSRDKGPAPPPPPMRQDSKNEERETAEKVNVVNPADKQESIEDKPQQVNKLPQNEKTAGQQVANVKEQKNFEDQNEFMDTFEKVKKAENEERGKLFDNIKRFENQQKLLNKPSSKRQLGINEKRKSAPVKPEIIEDLSKIMYNKQLFLRDKDE